MQKNKRRMLALLLTVVMVVSMLPVSFAADLSDVTGHWAEDYIEYGISAGYISGYTDGTFRPNKTVTRAEFSKMVNSALGIDHSVNITFTDVSASNWYYTEVRKAVSAGYISGYADNSFGADRSITRQEAAVILSRIVTEPETVGSVAYKDGASIDSWATSAVAKMAAKTYMKGDQNNNFRPKAALTRAEAAKVLYEVLKNEIIASNNQSFSIAGASYYNTIYPNNVTVTEGVADGDISFNSCRILGTLTARGGMDSVINLVNTGVNTLVAASDSGESKIALSGSSYVNKTTVNKGVALSGSSFGTVNLSGGSLSSDTVRLNGNFDTVNVTTSAVIKATGGTINQFTVYDRATVMLQSGNITRLDVEADAANSSIALSEGVTVGTAYIKAAANFTGTGKIGTAYEGKGEVTYETRPTNVVGGSSNNDREDEDDNNNNNDDNYDEDYAADLTPSFYPSNGTTGVSDEPTIRLYFDDTIYRSKSGSSMTASYIENSAVELREGSLSGRSVPFSASLNSSDTTVTISPDEYLEPDTRYYIVLLAGSVYSENGDTNKRAYAYFTTDDNNDYYDDGYSGSSKLNPTITPSNGKTNVTQSTTIRLAFSDTVYRSSGSTLSSSYLESNCIEIRENSTSGSKVNFTASLNASKSVITLTPTSKLDDNTTFYIIIPAGVLSDRNDNLNGRIVSRFSTGSSINGSDIMFYPENNAEDVAVDPEITIEFEDPVYQYGGGTVNARYLEESVLSLRRGSSSGTQVAFTAEISSDKRTVTIIPDETLNTNTLYYIKINAYSLQYSSSKSIPQTTSYFRTTDGTLRISDLSIGDTTSSTADIYVTSNTTGTVTVKIAASGETPQTQNVAVTAGRQTSMSFTGLESNTTYTVTATVKDGSGKVSTEKEETFRTGSLDFDLEATSITKNAATIEASYNAIGALSITYKEEGASSSKTALSKFTPNKVGTKSVTLSGLTEGTTYLVSATFEDASGNVITRDITFTTDTVSTETALESLVIHGSDGDYPVEILPDVYTYEVNIAYATSVTVTPVAAADDRATIKINGYAVRSGYTSSSISVRSSSTATYTTSIKVTVQAENGKTQTYTINVKVAPSNT